VCVCKYSLPVLKSVYKKQITLVESVSNIILVKPGLRKYRGRFAAPYKYKEFQG